MPQRLFAYGTLQPGLASQEIRPIMEAARFVARGQTPGRLYDLGDYPGAVFDESAPSFVHGSVFDLGDDAAVWPALDKYEGVDLIKPQAGLYTRVVRPVQLEDGRLLDCCAYAYNRSVDADRLIADGTYHGPSTPRP